MAKVEVSAKLLQFLANETSLLSRRINAMGGNGLDGPRRDIDEECQYPKAIFAEDFVKMYKREGYGRKVVESLPNECFCVDPDIRENENKRSSPFEKGVDELIDSDIAPLTALHKLDVEGGITRFGGMYYDLDDGLEPDKPAAGIDPISGRAGDTAPEPVTLNRLEVFNETQLRIIELEGDRKNPRRGLPITYELYRPDVQTYGSSAVTYRVPETGKWERVHWTRIQHYANDALPGALLGSPRQEGVWNRLVDLRKTLGGAGEMWWKGGFPGLSISADPNLIEAGATVQIDEASLKEQIQRYMDGLQRYIALVGMKAESMAPQIADPSAHVLVHLQAVACALDYPLRIFLGAEEAKVASGHEMTNWNRRIGRRQNKWLTPCVIRPFFNRCVALGVLPRTKAVDRKGTPVYKVKWPSIDVPNEDETSTIADRMADTLKKYIECKGYELIQPSDFLAFWMKFDPALVERFMANIKKPPEIEFTQEPPPGGGDSGVAGKPNSDPKPVSKK